MKDIIVPDTYNEWLILLKSNAPSVLSRKSIQERIKVLSNASNTETKQFCDLYGDAYRQKVVAWFQRAAREFKG